MILALLAALFVLMGWTPGAGGSGGAAATADLLTAALGFKAQTFPAPTLTNGGLLASQGILGSAIYLQAGQVISNVVVGVAQAGAGTAPTTIRLGVANSSGVMQAVTANVAGSANWTAGVANVSFPLTASWTVPASGLYYVLVYVSGGFTTTALQLERGSNANLGLPVGSGLAAYGQFGAAQADLPIVGASLPTFPAIAAQPALWFALS